MKNIVLYIFFSFFLLSCTHPSNQKQTNRIKKKVDNVILSDALNKKLDSLISNNKSLNRNYKKIYEVRFAFINKNCYVIISSNYYYHREVIDGYYFKGNNLVVFYNIEELKMNNIINWMNTIEFKDSISDYSDKLEFDIQYEVHPQKYKIVSPDSLELIPDTNPLYEKL